MTDAETKIIKAVTTKLTRELHVGATVFTERGRMATVLSIRGCAVGDRWVRVKFAGQLRGHWEYHETKLKLFGE